MRQPRSLRVGTLNVRSLLGRAAMVLELASEWRLDVLLIQEARLPRDSYGSLQALAQSHGWQVVVHEQGLTAQGSAQWGCVTLTRWPLEPLAAPEWLPAGRGGLMRVWRPFARPFLLCNLYLPASSRTEAGDILLSCFSHIAELGEEAVLMGDFNLVEADYPISDALASGFLRAANETIHGDAGAPPTFRGLNGYTRCLDYALHTGRLVFDYKHQVAGPADHDLVFYDMQLPVAPLPQHFRLQPPRPLQEEAVTTQLWHDVWNQHEASFRECLQRGAIDEAWALLSGTAENAMKASGSGRRRADPPCPQRSLPQSTKAPTLQSLKERRYRRLARRIAELMLRDHARSHSENLIKKIWRQAHGDGFVSATLPDLLEEVNSAADVEANVRKQQRVEAWKHRMHLDVNQASRWITRAPPPALVKNGEWTSPLEVTEKLAAAHESWTRLWGQSSSFDEGATDDLLNRFLSQAEPCEDGLFQFSPEEVAATVKRQRRRAAGMDGWTARQLSCLPSPFWAAVVQLWDTMLSAGVVPSGWKSVKVTLILKQDGSHRPLSIGCILWRALASLSCRRLRDWAASVFPDDIQGGVAGRGIHGVHNPLLSDLATTSGGRTHLYGIKTDVKKFFDNVRPLQAIRAAVHLGLPGNLARLIANFYTRQYRYLVMDGVAHPSPILVQCGLQQGCPMSVALVNSIMVVWHRAVTQASPTLRVKIFVDDRTCWALSDGAVGSLRRAAVAGSEVDDLFNLTVHPDKRASFGSSAGARRKLAPFVGELGPVQESFKLLGVHYSTKRGSSAPDVAALNELVTVRCERVSKACRNLRRRALLLRSVVVSALAWAASWQRYSAKTLQGWQSCIERALWTGQIPKQRSKLLARAVLGGPYLDLQFAGDLVVLRSEWRRRSRILCGEAAVVPAGAAWHQLCAKWGWVEAVDLSVHTLLGIYDPKWHSVEALMRAARHAWHQDLWNQDGRTVGAGPLGLRALVLQEHANLAERSNRLAFRVTTASAVDGRTLGYVGMPSTCACGEDAPSADHLLFQCPLAPPELSIGRTASERKLCLLAVPFYPCDSNMQVALDTELLDFLREAGRRREDIIVATDGGCLVAPGLEYWQRGAWAVIVKAGSSELELSGLLHGPEQTPAAAERMALAVIAEHTRVTGARGYVFSDNDAAIRRLRRAAAGSLVGPLAFFWKWVAAGLGPLLPFWIPSHGKRLAWRAPGGLSSAVVRRLNAAADAACTRQLKTQLGSWEAAQAAVRDARSWSSRALTRLYQVSEPYADRLRTVYGAFRSQHCA